MFETLKVTEHGAFAVRRHLNRLNRSAAALGLPEPDHGQICEAIDAVLDGRDFRVASSGSPTPVDADRWGPRQRMGRRP